MKTPVLDCQSERRRHEVRRQEINGLDYLEVSDDQLRLTIYFLGAAPEGLGTEHFAVTGGERIRDIAVVEVETCPQVDDDLDNCVVVTVDRPGDFSTYTICLVDPPEPDRFDPRYRCLDFSFKAACPTDLDCKSERSCPPEPRDEPDISYLAKDYASFRRLILDRLAGVMPEWNESHVPDVGITLVELLAYAGDYLSYYQDAAATEAYLGTARQRISVRRHARLVDYMMHEGSNARAWVHINTSTDATLPASQLSFLTGFDEAPEITGRPLLWTDLAGIPAGRFEIFEPLADAGAEIDLFTAHNRIPIYTWGDLECCLPRGATSATLVDGPVQPPGPDPDPDDDEDGCDDTEPYQKDPGDEKPPRQEYPPDKDPEPERVLRLAVGDLLLFEEIIGPGTGDLDDADPAHRHVVRLTRVEPTVDALYGQPLLEVGWGAEDALPFPLCVSVLGPAPECAVIEDVSVARGNVLLADHGRGLDEPEDLGCVPVETEETVCEREGRPSDVIRHPGCFRPVLAESPLTFSQPLPPTGPAARLLDQDPRLALPWVRLSSQPGCDGPSPENGGPQREWTPRRDLLASGADDDHFVVEMDDRRRAHLRFGDGELGSRPQAELAFGARYRTGNGPVGNVGADTLTLAVTDELVSGVTLAPRNPLPARGGTAPEPLVDVKLFAPHAFRQTLERAITADDYAALAGQHPAVQRAAAELRWNGSWYEARVAVDPLGRTGADAALLAEIDAHLRRFRRIGHDLAVLPAHYVPLDVALCVCVERGFLRAHVLAALLEAFSDGCLADGSLGFFHPDALSFDDNVSVSRLVARAQTVTGVASATVTKLERLFEGPYGEIEAGILAIGALEIARLDNDPSFPENGRIRFDLGGGR